MSKKEKTLKGIKTPSRRKFFKVAAATGAAAAASMAMPNIAFGLDVYNGEPKIHPEYLKLDNIFLLPHLGSATKRTRWDMAYRATQNLEDFFSKGEAKDKVN